MTRDLEHPYLPGGFGRLFLWNYSGLRVTGRRKRHMSSSVQTTKNGAAHRSVRRYCLAIGCYLPTAAAELYAKSRGHSSQNPRISPKRCKSQLLLGTKHSSHAPFKTPRLGAKRSINHILRACSGGGGRGADRAVRPSKGVVGKDVPRSRGGCPFALGRRTEASLAKSHLQGLSRARDAGAHRSSISAAVHDPAA